MTRLFGMRRIAALVVLAPALGLGSVACGGDEETIETDAGDVSVSRDGEDVHVTARDGNGWSVDQEMNMMGQRMLHASKGGRSLMVQVMERDGGSHAMVHLGEDG